VRELALYLWCTYKSK